MTHSKKKLVLATFNIIGYLVVLVVNTLANTLPLGGKTTGEISDLYPNLFVPAGITFAIWGVIYVLLGIYVVYGLIYEIRHMDQNEDFVAKTGGMFLVTCAANVGWIFSWQYRVLPLSMICMVVLLVALLIMYQRLAIGKAVTRPSGRYLTHMPISIYLGWISVATIANVSVLLVAYHWNRFGISEQVWASVMMLVAITLGMILLFKRRDAFYAVVIDWALLGIFMKRTEEGSIKAPLVVVTAVLGLALLTACIVVQLLRRRTSC